MKYAVIVSGGKQYKVSERDEVLVDKLEEEKDDKITFKEVLLIKTDDKMLFGTPYLKDCLVEGKILNHQRGKKIIVAKFKAKSRYRKRQGFRSELTRILIEKISIKKDSKPKSAPKMK